MTVIMSRYILNTLLSHTVNTAKAVLLPKNYHPSRRVVVDMQLIKQEKYSTLTYSFFDLYPHPICLLQFAHIASHSTSESFKPLTFIFLDLTPFSISDIFSYSSLV